MNAEIGHAVIRDEVGARRERAARKPLSGRVRRGINARAVNGLASGQLREEVGGEAWRGGKQGIGRERAGARIAAAIIDAIVPHVAVIED